MGRRSVWSDPKVIALAEQFVPAADEVWRLQRADDPECHFFRRAVNGNTKLSRGTMQGIYVISPNGKLLARRLSNDAAKIRSTMEKGLAAWRALPAADRRLGKHDIRSGFRWEDSYPEGGLILMRTCRDLPRDGAPTAKPAVRFNRDTVWFSREEAATWLPTELRVGAQRALDRVLIDRLARTVFVDNVRGQTIPYAHKEVAKFSALRTEVVACDERSVELKITGRVGAASAGKWIGRNNNWKHNRAWPHSIETRVLGTAKFDRKNKVFTALELVALGRRDGRTVNNGRHGRSGPGSIGFVVQLARPGWRVAPTFLNVYRVDWVTRPAGR